MHKKAIIVGASSGIGLEVAKLLLADSWHLGVAARREEPLLELKAKAPERLEVMTIDVTKPDAGERLQSLIERLGGMDLYFHASGIGKQNLTLEESIELNTMETNAVGFTKMIGSAYRYFAERGSGHIAAITSIAGTKGLGPAPAYSATKALQATYLQSLEQQAHQRGLNICFTDIRPGFVDTALLNDNFPYPMMMRPEKVARDIVRSIYRRRHVRVIDFRYRVLTFLWRLIPNWLWRRMKLVSIILLLCFLSSVNAQDKKGRWVESINVLSPTPCSEISGRVKVSLQAKGMEHLVAQCYVFDAKHTKPQKSVLTHDCIKLDENGVGTFLLNAKKLPHGPLTIQIIGDNAAGEHDLYELQLYNTAGKQSRIAGIPDTIPSAAQGMQLVYSDDFDGPLSISRDGRGARYNAHKPTFGDFSGWPFCDPEGAQNPFMQKDTYLIIRARKDEGTRGSTGLIATVDMDGNGFRATPPCYMECRLMAQSAPGTWPAFWTITNIHRGEGDELDIIEAYGGWGDGNPNSTGYWVTSHFWGQKDEKGEPLKHPGKLIEMTERRLGTSWSQTFHTYGLRIDSLQTTYYLDDEEVWSHPTNSYSYEQSHVLLINYAIGGASGWKVNLERYNNTSEMYVDYLRVFEQRNK